MALNVLCTTACLCILKTIYYTIQSIAIVRRVFIFLRKRATCFRIGFGGVILEYLYERLKWKQIKAQHELLGHYF